jgi:hypothetical protein
MSSKLKRSAAYVAFGVAAALGGLWLYQRFQRFPIEQDARTLLSAIQHGDAQPLYEHAYPEEREALGLTPAKIQKVQDELIQPRFRPYDAVGPVQTMVNRDGSQAVAWQRMKDAKGHSFDLNVAPWASPSGARMTGLARLQTAWIVEYRVSKGLSSDGIGTLLGEIEGVKHDKQALYDIGIPGLMWEGKVTSWDEYQAILEGFLKERQADHGR